MIGQDQTMTLGQADYSGPSRPRQAIVSSVLSDALRRGQFGVENHISDVQFLSRVSSTTLVSFWTSLGVGAQEVALSSED